MQGANRLDNLSPEKRMIKNHTEILMNALDLSPLVKIKNALNEVYGAERNQIDNPFEHSDLLPYLKQKDFQDRFSSYLPDILQLKLVNIYIHFPLITIENSKGNKREIHDLYVKMQFNLNFKLTDQGILGAVASYKKDALNGNYRHSHLPSQRFNEFSYFCLGSGTPMSMMVQRLHADPFDENKFKLFLYNIREFVKWESLEGGPHIHISEVSKASTTDHWLARHYSKDQMLKGTGDAINFISGYNSIYEDACVKMIAKMSETEEGKNKVIENFFTYKMEGTNIILIPTVELSTYLAEEFFKLGTAVIASQNVTERNNILRRVVPGASNISGSTFFGDMAYKIVYYKTSADKYVIDGDLYRTLTGSSFPGTRTSHNSNYIGRKIFNFKDKPISVTLIEEKEKEENKQKETISTESHHIHPIILKNVTHYFALKANKQLITTCSSGRENTPHYITEAPKTDILAMLES